ncbi:MAG: hypothetical protein OXU20_13215 [Myxococcales bacterium]|nr:hypothetical protein [Myxococcales bacterium]
MPRGPACAETIVQQGQSVTVTVVVTDNVSVSESRELSVDYQIPFGLNCRSWVSEQWNYLVRRYNLQSNRTINECR